jgi:hydroxymethylpyrimidine pyrophosphatase-like HAD family hydrolase
VTTHTLESLSGAPKVVAADLDGTLLPLVLDGSQGLTALTVQTVNTLTRLGIRTILVTGRMFSSAASFAAQLGLTGLEAVDRHQTLSKMKAVVVGRLPAWAGTGMAMAGAPPEVAAVADDFCGRWKRRGWPAIS